MRVLICGAEIGGLALALMLGRLGWKTEVVERASGVREEGYMIRLRQLAYPVDELNYVDRNGRPRASLDIKGWCDRWTDDCSACYEATWPARSTRISAGRSRFVSAPRYARWSRLPTKFWSR